MSRAPAPLGLGPWLAVALGTLGCSLGVTERKREERLPLPPATSAETARLEIAHGAVAATPIRPNVVVYLPRSFDRSALLDVVVFLHGWWNCADNVLRPSDGACGVGRAPRNAYDLAAQLEDSRRNAILIVPELAFDQASSDPGERARLAEPGHAR